MRLRIAGVAALIVLPPTTACTPQGGCTDMGGTNGVGVEIPKSLFVHSGRVDFEVCDDDGCASASKPLDHLRDRVGRGSGATFDDLGRDFDPGDVDVSVRLFDSSDTLIAATEQTVELELTYPNGRECDGDGYVSGGISLKPDDRV